MFIMFRPFLPHHHCPTSAVQSDFSSEDRVIAIPLLAQVLLISETIEQLANQHESQRVPN